jgi:cellulose synthase/poly-beta-1,6-N-acetylglucosamine synthase-like glycosyltransferase
MTAATLTAAAGGVFMLLALHPFMTYPLILRLFAWLRPMELRPRGAAYRHSVAVCVCAYNEARVIAARIENLLNMRATIPDLRILVYVDGATDGTADIVRSFGGDIMAVVAEDRHGKTHGMNTLVAKADTDIVVFSDANVMFAPDAVSRLLAPFADPTVGCVCGHLRYSQPGGATAATGSLYWRMEEKIKALESATGSVMGADGSIFAIRRTLHRPPPPDLIDDMFVSLSIMCGGARVVRAGDAFAFEEAVSRPREEFRRKVRIACQAFNVHRALWPALVRLPKPELFKYVSHKLLRWISIFSFIAACLLFGLSLALVGAWTLLAAIFALEAAMIAIVVFACRGPAARIREIAASLIATGLGVVQSMRGRKFQTWTPPTSARALSALWDV